MERKKKIERAVLDKYLKIRGYIDVKIHECESPDFICFVNGKMVGFEITEDTNAAEQLANKFATGHYEVGMIEKIGKGKVKQVFKNAYQPVQSPLIDYNQMIKTAQTKIDKIKDYKPCDSYVIIVYVTNPLKDPSSIDIKNSLNLLPNVIVSFLWNDHDHIDKVLEVSNESCFIITTTP